MKPNSIQAAVLDYSGFIISEAIASRMTEKKVRDYFTPENFSDMFSGDVPEWPWTWEQLADCALELMAEAMGE